MYFIAIPYAIEHQQFNRTIHKMKNRYKKLSNTPQDNNNSTKYVLNKIILLSCRTERRFISWRIDNLVHCLHFNEEIHLPVKCDLL